MKTLHDGTIVEDSVPTKNISGERYLLTPDENAQREVEEAHALKQKPLKEWEAKIAATQLPRYVEDIIDALDAQTKAKIAKQTLDLYEEKKTVRAEKPKEK